MKKEKTIQRKNHQKVQLSLKQDTQYPSKNMTIGILLYKEGDNGPTIL